MKKAIYFAEFLFLETIRKIRFDNDSEKKLKIQSLNLEYFDKRFPQTGK